MKFYETCWNSPFLALKFLKRYVDSFSFCFVEIFSVIEFLFPLVLFPYLKLIYSNFPHANKAVDYCT